ncbi:MAG TPA: hypothetical protein VF707_05530 [Ardenticatenaceae bacterium]|jgi:hypothetical protein
MPGREPLNADARDQIQEQLNGNLLLAALMMVSPPDALKQLGHEYKNADFDDVQPPDTGDAKHARHLLSLLKEGRTTLDGAAILQPVADADLLRPPTPKRRYDHPADVTTTVSRAAIQHGVAAFAKERFRREEFDFPAKAWWSLAARGETLTLDLSQEATRLVAAFEGKLDFDFWLRDERVQWSIDVPLRVEVSRLLGGGGRVLRGGRARRDSRRACPFPAQPRQ